ncbi:hypothetical protein KL864_33265 [Mycolicibacterium goodii]|nr:hypothetical protein [Mycolicibacterium goodii]MBU8820741.1 hypothetical protein [Mycolicibacterium goodii]
MISREELFGKFEACGAQERRGFQSGQFGGGFDCHVFVVVESNVDLVAPLASF